jgi:hypothetical protein
MTGIKLPDLWNTEKNIHIADEKHNTSHDTAPKYKTSSKYGTIIAVFIQV